MEKERLGAEDWGKGGIRRNPPLPADMYRSRPDPSDGYGIILGLNVLANESIYTSSR